MLMTPKLLLVSSAAAAALALSGCAGGGMSGMEMSGSDAPAASETAAADFNGADVMFAQMMIPHHEQAVEMSDALLAKDGIHERVRDLATQIKDAQQPEIDQLREMLSDWSQEESDMGDMNHGRGMMSDHDVVALEDAARLFLEQMTMHHEGAIEMVEAEVADGENAEAKKLAEAIVAAQTDEIAFMRELLADLSSEDMSMPETLSARGVAHG